MGVNPANPVTFITALGWIRQMENTTIQVHGYAAIKSKSALTPFNFERRSPGDHDMVIDIQYCGICHSDIHQAGNEWGDQSFQWFQGMRSWVLSHKLVEKQLATKWAIELELVVL